MWLLSLFPDSLVLWIVDTILLAGVLGVVASFFITFIPLINQYRLPVQVVSIILLVIGVYLRGGYVVEMEWRERVRQVEVKVQKAEAEAREANLKLDAAIKAKTDAVKANTIVIQEKIKVVEKKINENCVVTPEVIDILNQAAKNGVKK